MEENNTQQKNMNAGGNKNMMLLVVGVILVVLVGIGAFYFMGQKSSTEQVADDTLMEVPAPGNEGVDEMVVDEEADGETMTEGEVREITVEGDEFNFNPSSVTVTEGETIRVTFENVGTAPHNFVIDELGVTTETIPSGGTDTVEFTADQTGTFSFYCSVGNHRELGMEGEIEVQ